jgi:CheY-like chemotaxis protein
VPATKPKILVIENELDRLIYITNLLKAHGFEPLTADHPAEAITKAHAQKPSLIVMDAMLPVEQIQSVYGRLKSTPSLEKVPVVMLSSLTRQGAGRLKQKPYALAIGRWPAPEAYLPNPPEAEDFIAVIRRLTTATRGIRNTEGV